MFVHSHAGMVLQAMILQVHKQDLLSRLVVIGLGNPNKIVAPAGIVLEVYQYSTSGDFIADIFNREQPRHVAQSLQAFEPYLARQPQLPFGWHDVLTYLELLQLSLG